MSPNLKHAVDTIAARHPGLRYTENLVHDLYTTLMSIVSYDLADLSNVSLRQSNTGNYYIICSHPGPSAARWLMAEIAVVKHKTVPPSWRTGSANVWDWDLAIDGVNPSDRRWPGKDIKIRGGE